MHSNRVLSVGRIQSNSVCVGGFIGSFIDLALLVLRCCTIEEDEKDARVGELLAAQQVDVFHPQVEGQLDDGAVLHVSGDVCHQSQVLHQTACLRITTRKPCTHTFISSAGMRQHWSSDRATAIFEGHLLTF